MKIFEAKGYKKIILIICLLISICFAISHEVIARFSTYGIVSYLIIIGIAIVLTAIYEIIFEIFNLALKKDYRLSNILRFISILFNIYLFIIFRLAMLSNLFSMVSLILTIVGVVITSILGLIFLNRLYKSSNILTFKYLNICSIFILLLIMLWGSL